jgi:hypothetical protein
MNHEHDSLPEPGDDPMLDEALSHLKRLEPPLETRIGNRIAVADALSSLRGANRQRRLPWWRRSVSIPVPIAASVLVVLAAFVAQSGLRGGPEQPPAHTVAPVQSAEFVADASRNGTTGSAPNSRPVLKYREAQTYVCGIGRLKSESGYFIKEQNR